MPNYQNLFQELYGKSTEDALALAIEIYKSAGAELKDVQARAKGIIEEICTETGVTDWATPSGKVYIPKPSVSVRYDAKAQDALCASDDNVKRLLWPHRSESERAGSLTIR